MKKFFGYLTAFFICLCTLLHLGCGEISVPPNGCEDCKDRCLREENANRGRCVNCLKDVHCQDATSPTKKCTADNRCICGTDQDCSSGRYCKGESGCVECTQDAQCKNPDRPHCLFGSDTCVTCKPQTVEKCQSANSCGKTATKICGNAGIWGKCEGGVVCKENEACVEDRCIPTCPSVSPCKEGEAVCTSAKGGFPGRFKVCQKNASGCWEFSPEQTCQQAEYCDAGVCRVCSSVSCKVGEKRCADSSSFQICEQDTFGCLGWSSKQGCSAGLSCRNQQGFCTLCEPNEERDCYSGDPSTRNKGTCRSGKQTCASDGSAFGTCQGEVLPVPERCNGKDDNCNGSIDESFSNLGQSCEVGKGECKAVGKYVCTSDGSGTECDAKPGTPTAELCDKKDNNCDGSVDEGCPCVLGDTQPCGSDTGECKKGTQICDINGKWGVCSGDVKSATEVCNGKDDDCDGQIDNGFTNLGQSCDVGQGECKAVGKYSCKADGSDTECDAKPGQASTEVCDGKDNDCNGKIDDIAELNQTCTDTNRKGVCQTGVWGCVNNQKICNQATQASSEICDGKDNDCNGLIDDNVSGCFQKCTSNTECPPSYPNCQAGQCVRFCKLNTDCDDTYQCQQGFCQNCPDDTKQSNTEICDGKDNNCNGQIDESFPENQKACTVQNQQGECAKGTYTACNQGALLCTGPSSQTEICNGKDDNCDGQIDNQCGFFWASSSGGGHHADYYEGFGYSVALDSAGNIYITGSFSGTAIFGPTTLTSNGGHDIFVAKLSNQGSFQWVVSAGGQGNDWGQSIAVDSAGNIYISGVYQQLAAFGLTTIILSGGGGFVAKLNNQGSFQWAVSAGYGSIAVDSGGNIYTIGSFGGVVRFGPTVLTSNNASGDIYVAKLNNQGAFQWAVSAGGVGSDFGERIAVDSAGNIYITGVYNKHGPYNGTAIFGPTTLTGNGYSLGLFVAKLNNQGAFQWAVSASGSYLSSRDGLSIAVDGAGNIYITGFYNGTAIFGTTGLASRGGDDIFVAKLNNQGVFQWAISAGSTQDDSGQSMAVDSSGNIYITGSYNGIVSFGSTTLTSNGGGDIFVAKLSNQGAFQWAISAGGTLDDSGRGMAIDSVGNLYITGSYQKTAIFSSTSLTSQGYNNIFVGKLR